jgi:hypothetical protein
VSLAPGLRHGASDILPTVAPHRQALAKAAFFSCAAPLVALVAVRVTVLERRLQLDELAHRLRQARPFPRLLRGRPRWWAGTVERLLPVLPPWRLGPCFKRSLLLLDLWARCGLEPRLHLSVRHSTHSEPGYEGHAWVSTGNGPEAPATSSLGYPTAFEL